MMEIERLKTLKAEEERERLRLEAQRRGAAVIIDQIKEREIQRIAEKEQRTKEQKQMAGRVLSKPVESNGSLCNCDLLFLLCQPLPECR